MTQTPPPRTRPWPQRVATWWLQRRADRESTRLRRRCPPAWVAASRIPPGVREAWVRQFALECPGRAADELTWLRSSVALAQFFEACRLQRERGACALPSRAADSVWHAWLAWDAPGLAQWQRRYFDLEVPHREAEALGAPLADSLARTWAGACASEGLSPLGPRLPLVFALDGLLALPNGWAYRFEALGLVHRDIDAAGRSPGRGILHAEVAGASLVGLGLLGEAELQALRRQQAAQGGSSCGGAATGPSGACEGSGGGCDGGSGCGGGDGGGGGGCGGGGGS